MVKLMQVMAASSRGGAETFFIRLTAALARAGQEQKVVIRRNSGHASLLRESGIEPVELRFGGPLEWMTRRHLGRQIAEWKPDVVLTWMNRATIKTPPGPFVHVARLGGYYDLKYYRRCDHLIGNTPDIVEYLVAEGWPPARAHLIPNFVEGRPGKPLQRSLFDTPDASPLLIAVGRLHPNKGFDVLLRALATVPGAYLWLVGSGPLDAELRGLAETCGVADRVRFLGWREDVVDLVATADMLVCPSRHEPFGNVVVEGWAQSRPVVAAASDGPAWVIRDGENGLLVPIEDADALAAAIRHILGDGEFAGRLATAGHAAYLAGFTEAHTVKVYMEFLAKITARAR